MKSFRDITKATNESPVGKVGRTKDSEAAEHIETSGLAKQFRKIVKQLGGKNVARQLLANMNQKGDIVTQDTITEVKESPEKYLRDAGFKIKSEEPINDGKEIEFYKKTAAEEALEDLKSAGFGKYYNLSLANIILTYKEV